MGGKWENLDWFKHFLTRMAKGGVKEKMVAE